MIGACGIALRELIGEPAAPRSVIALSSTQSAPLCATLSASERKSVAWGSNAWTPTTRRPADCAVSTKLSAPSSPSTSPSSRTNVRRQPFDSASRTCTRACVASVGTRRANVLIPVG